MKKLLIFCITITFSSIIHAQLSSEIFDIKIIRGEKNFTKIWDDRGSGAKESVSIWRPKVPAGYYFLGDVVIKDWESRLITNELITYVIKPKPGKGGYINRSKGSELIWTDTGSGAKKNLKLYRSKCISNYRSLGVLGNSIPSNFVCVNPRATIQSKFDNGSDGKPIWTDAGSGADKDASFWRVGKASRKPDKGQLAISPNTFYFSDKQDKKPNEAAYSLLISFKKNNRNIYDSIPPEYSLKKPFYSSAGILKRPEVVVPYKNVPFTIVKDNLSALDIISQGITYDVNRIVYYYVRNSADNTGGNNEVEISTSDENSIDREKDWSRENSATFGAEFTIGTAIKAVEVSATVSTELSTAMSWGGSETIGNSRQKGITMKINAGEKGAILESINKYEIFRIKDGRRTRIDAILSSNLVTGDDAEFITLNWPLKQ